MEQGVEKGQGKLGKERECRTEGDSERDEESESEGRAKSEEERSQRVSKGRG